MACIVDPTNGYTAIYTNGVLEIAQTNTLPPLKGISTAWSFLGRSLFGSDPYLNAIIDEFRIYDGRLTPQEIATDCQFGPNALALPVTLAETKSSGSLSLTWPSWAVGFVLESSTNLAGGAWTPVISPGSLANNTWSMTVTPTNAVKFYKLQR